VIIEAMGAAGDAGQGVRTVYGDIVLFPCFPECQTLGIGWRGCHLWTLDTARGVEGCRHEERPCTRR
jgi:hypothetical protein